MYENLCLRKPKSSPGICAWNPQIQLKVAMFVWKLWWDHAPTIDNLIRRGIAIPNWCCLCISAGESFAHLFLHCPRVYSLWSYFWVRVGVKWVHPGTVRSMLSCWLSQRSRDRRDIGRHLWILVPTVLWWSTWEERDRRVFDGSMR